MSYNNYNPFPFMVQGNNQQQQRYSRPYNQNQAYRYNQQPRQGYKRSGATYSIIHAEKSEFRGMPIVNAWKKTRAGLIKFNVKPYKASFDKCESRKGNSYIKMICEITYPMSAPELVPCLFNETTKKIVLESKGLVITPNGSGMTRSGKAVKGAVVSFRK